MSTKYSEIMISTGSWHTYEIGLLLAATWMFLGALAAGVLSRQKAAAFFLGLSISLFLVLKQGLVRADWSHIRYQMVSIMAPCIVILFLLAYSSQFRISTPLKLSSLIFFALLMLIVFYKYNGILTNQEGIISMYADSWKKVGSRLDSGLAGQDSKRLAEQIANVRSRHESLFSFLEGRCQTLRSHEEKASIMFYPWESIFAEVVPDCRWQPSPSLQIYAAGPCTKIQHMDADLLASAKRPEIVVIGAGTIDHRNSVSEYSGILAQLFHNYHVSGKIEDYVVLESDKGAGHFSEPITCSEKPKGSKGEFLRLKLKSLGTGYVLLWRIATFLFKAPELTVEISARDRQDGDITFSFRGYLSQLRQGVYVSNDVVDRFIFKTFRLSDNMLATVSEQKRPPRHQ